MCIEVVAKTWYTIELTDEDVEKVKQYIKDHEDNLKSYSAENKIRVAISELRSHCKIELFGAGKETESDFLVEEINWSEFEERSAEDILHN